MSRQLSKWGTVAAVALVAGALVPAASWQSDAASPTASSSTTSAPAKDGRIVAANLDTGQLETLNPDGSAVQSVTPGGEHAFDPAWSPDSSRIVFVSDHAGPDPRIFTIKADGTGMHQVTTAADGYVDNTPTYSPDGQHIIFARCRPDPPGGCALYSIRTNGQGLKAVTSYSGGDQADFWPDVSPDGSRLAWTRFGEAGITARVYVAKIDGSNAHAITTPALEAGAPRWTAGHHLLVTSSFSHYGDNVYRICDNGTGATRLTSAPFPHSAQFGTTSPSGSHIVYSTDQAYPGLDGDDLYVMNPNGSGKHAIATDTHLLDPDWGTAPLIKASTSNLVTPKALKATPRRAPNLPSWISHKYGVASAPASKWSR